MPRLNPANRNACALQSDVYGKHVDGLARATGEQVLLCLVSRLLHHSCNYQRKQSVRVAEAATSERSRHPLLGVHFTVTADSLDLQGVDTHASSDLEELDLVS
jgi:hypothetical protein